MSPTKYFNICVIISQYPYLSPKFTPPISTNMLLDAFRYLFGLYYFFLVRVHCTHNLEMGGC